MKDSSIKYIRRAPIVIFIFIIIMVAFSSIMCFRDVSKVVIFKARVSRNFPERTYNRVKLGENTFITGMVGDVHWYPKSFKEAYILTNIVKENTPCSVIDMAYLLLFDIILFWMVFDIKEGDVFGPKAVRGLRLFSLLIGLWMGRGFLHFVISNYFLADITNGQLSAAYPDFSIMPYLGFALFFQQLFNFFLKARRIEREQELTI